MNYANKAKNTITTSQLVFKFEQSASAGSQITLTSAEAGDYVARPKAKAKGKAKKPEETTHDDVGDVGHGAGVVDPNCSHWACGFDRLKAKVRATMPEEPNPDGVEDGGGAEVAKAKAKAKATMPEEPKPDDVEGVDGDGAEVAVPKRKAKAKGGGKGKTAKSKEPDADSDEIPFGQPDPAGKEPDAAGEGLHIEVEEPGEEGELVAYYGQAVSCPLSSAVALQIHSKC